MKKRLLVIVLMVSLMMAIPFQSYGASGIKDLVTYNVSFTGCSTHGQLYWDYGQIGDFFLNYGLDGGYNSDCYISSGREYKWSKALTRKIIAIPDEGYTFAGLYSAAGKKYSITSCNMDVIKLTSKGIIYYDYVKSFDNPELKNYTRDKYKTLTKAALKAIYGVSRYSVVETVTMYSIPKKNATYVAKFVPKASQVLTGKELYEKSFGDLDFVLQVKNTVDSPFTFKSKSPSVVSIDKYNGLAKIKGEGKVEIVITAPVTKEYEKATLSVFIVVKPTKVSLESAASKRAGNITLTWSRDSKCSGYEIAYCKSSTFKGGVETKTVGSSKTTSKVIKSLDKGAKYHVRIRAYKKSCGKKIYGPWSNAKSVTTK